MRQASHNRFTCAGIIGKQETDLRLWQEEFINRFHLMRQRVNHRAVDGKERVELVGRVDAFSLRKENELFGVALEVELSVVGKYFEGFELRLFENFRANFARVDADIIQ